MYAIMNATFVAMNATYKTSPLRYYTGLVLPLTAWMGLEMGGYWTALTTIVAFVLLPLADTLRGVDNDSPSSAEIIDLESRWSYRIVLYVNVVVQTLLLTRACFVWGNGAQAWYELAFQVLGVGIVTGGLGITIAHELGHRTIWWEKLLGYVLLAQVWYTHFVAEHTAGHHKNVGLQQDPATARYGESAYAFVARSVVQSWLHVWTMEAARLRSKGKAPYGISNRMWMWSLISPALTLGIGLIGGWHVALLFTLQAVIAFVLLELVNYVEHYGLERKEIKPGIVEKFAPKHAWESRFIASNYTLFKLQRHADHHLMPQRRYQSLRVHDDSPQLPHGYPAMLLLSLVPPLWRSVVHRRMSATS
jgi:alkane 1-monooxygenase